MWSSICFVGLTVNNVAMFIDLVVFPDVDLRLLRLVPALVGMSCLLFGFIHTSPRKPTATDTDTCSAFWASS